MFKAKKKTREMQRRRDWMTTGKDVGKGEKSTFLLLKVPSGLWQSEMNTHPALESI